VSRLYPLNDGIGFVELIDSMGNDLKVANAARASYAKFSPELNERDKRLVARMLREHHGSPFEHSVFTFAVKAPLFVVQQWERHRIASYSEESGRYVELAEEFYTPHPELRHSSIGAYACYKWMLKNGESKELARLALPLSLYKSFWFTINARSLMNFLNLRNDEHAQWEIRQYAIAIEQIFAERMPETHKAFVEYGRIAP
jgi:thymidylate synthase (FAD)